MLCAFASDIGIPKSFAVALDLLHIDITFKEL